MISFLLRLLEGVGILIYLAGGAPRIIARRPRAVRVVLYHAVEDGESDYTVGLRSTVRPSHFRAQVDFIRKHYAPVTTSEAGTAEAPDCGLAVCFDDAYRSVSTVAAPVLHEAGWPFTIFAVSSAIGNTSLIWVNELNAMLHREPALCTPIVRRALKRSVARDAATLVDAVRASLAPSDILALLNELRAQLGWIGRDVAPRAALYLSWGELAQLRALGALVGNHTATHFSLPSCSEEEAAQDILAGRTAIEEQLGTCNGFAFPFGDRSPHVDAVAVLSGERRLFCVGGSQSPESLPHLARTPAPDAGAAVLFARLEIVEPLKAWLRDFSASA